ncbi:P-loop containing nucleoside triphosphate hydrolase protein [Hypomontagnella monticulosa]|nr:P-loop containing nucleoside triphosphate hydrolase protein [Hypomontagnella monticulosa]
MAGAKKKKSKPTANPARGFATTSIASKPRAEINEPAQTAVETGKLPSDAPPTSSSRDPNAPPSNPNSDNKPNSSQQKQALSPEEFERQLEESELQLLVEKYAQKVKRDAQRQKSRLETDRRLLRGQAESLNTRKWLPQELMDHILDLIQAESRFGASSFTSDNTNSSGKLPSEEDLLVKLWTLQLTLTSAGFSDDKVKAVLQYVLDIAASINGTAKDTIWGLEEALDWLARECTRDELHDYDYRGRSTKSQADTPLDSPLPSGANTPRLLEINGVQKPSNQKNPKPIATKKAAVVCHEDIEPDDLIPAYLETKAKLFQLQRPRQDINKGGRAKNGKNQSSSNTSSDDIEEAKLLAKIDKIEQDVLFDRFAAEQKWRTDRIELEKEFAAKKQAERQAEEEAKQNDAVNAAQEAQSDDDDDVTREAQRIAAEILKQDGSDDDQALSDLFASLPVQETDAATGKTSTVINGADGVKITIRDFGKWTSGNPTRTLEETCRSRDSGVKIIYKLVSENSYSHRHLVSIHWSKPQELIPVPNIPSIESAISPQQFVFQMASVATPDSKQSEAYIATLALFVIFGSTKEEKVFMRLPATWRELWSELAEDKKNQTDAADRTAIKEVRALVRQKLDQELEDGVLLQGAFRGRASLRNANDASDDSAAERGPGNAFGPEYYQSIWAHKSSTPKFQTMLRSRMQLPMWHFREQVLSAVEREQVVIICGETGCGKSTQVPSFLLEHQLAMGRPCKIYCTEPRRISAISLARRVSEELGEGRGDLGTSRSLVGYSIRLESNTSKETRLVYATTGIVMRMLEGSNELREITHLVLDEVHERSIDSDFLLIVLKKLLIRRKDLKVVLMSATVDAERFSNYLGRAPVLNVPGRTFPVQVKYLEDALEATGYVPDQLSHEKMTDLDDDPAEMDADDSGSTTAAAKELRQYSARTRNTLSQLDEYQIEFDLIVRLIGQIAVDPTYVNYSKAILVFLPGIAEIRTLNDSLLGEPFFQRDWEIFPLHSTIATEDQERAFLVPPEGVRKIVLATNIAETGITIPDVTCVIDTGKHREMRFDERRQLSRLIDTFISRANAKQRRGRAGRVQEGLCFHLFTKYRHDHLMSDQQTPEMLRLSLQDLAIRVKICKIGGIEETLGEALDAPSAKNIRRAIDALVDVRALTNTEELTPLGHQLARLPLDVFLGKLILQGTVFKCLDMAITAAAILSSKSPFTASFGQRSQADQARKAFRRGDSDLLTVYNAYLGWKKVCQTSNAEFQYCKKNFLSPQTLSNIEDLKGQLLVSLADSGFLQLTDEERRTLNRLRYSSGRRRQQQFYELPQRVNINSDNDVITASVIAWSFYPKLLVREGKGFRNVGNNQSISLHPSSVNKGHMELKWLSYYHIMQSKQFLNAHETTAAESFAIALLCGDVRIDMYAGVLVLDGNRARFSAPDWKTLLAIKALRARLRELLTRSFRNPGRLPIPQHEKWLDAWQRVFAQDFSARA